MARELDEYFAGRRHTFDVPVDLQLAHGFRRTVLEHLRTSRTATTESYATVAAAAGNPAAVRAVGTACAPQPGAARRAVPPGRAQRRHRRCGTGAVREAKRALLALEASG